MVPVHLASVKVLEMTYYVSFPFLGLLGLLFIGLKLAGTIAWSWWWVLVPLWGPLAVGAALVGCWLVLSLILKMTE